MADRIVIQVISGGESGGLSVDDQLTSEIFGLGASDTDIVDAVRAYFLNGLWNKYRDVAGDTMAASALHIDSHTTLAE